MIHFTGKELRDLIIAFIVLSLAFAIVNVGLDAHGILSIFPIVMVGVGVGFLLHEVAHKYVAMKYGYQTEFKAWPLGLVIALATAFIGWVFAAPGSVNIHADSLSDEMNGRIAVAGSMANMALAIVFIIIAALIYPSTSHVPLMKLVFLTCTVGFSVNSFLAAFNLLPVYTLDGIKVLKWNFKVWIIVFAIAVIMLLMAMSIGAESMVKLLIGM